MNRTHTIFVARTASIVLILVLLMTAWAQEGSADESDPTDTDSVTIAEVLAESSGFSTLVTALGAAELTETFDSEGTFTLFAPTDAAFARFSQERLTTLIENSERLGEILRYHAADETISSEALVDRDSISTLSGATVSVRVVNQVVYVGDAIVTGVDIRASNGVIHIIDTVLLPPSSE